MLIKWLSGICLNEARRTGTHHDRLRAGVFMSLAGMRALLGNAGPTLTETELCELERLNALYHDSLNGFLTSQAYLYSLYQFADPIYRSIYLYFTVSRI